MTKIKSTNHLVEDRRWACPGLFRMPLSADGGICRIKLDQGHVSATQLRALARLVKKYGDGLLEVTTRANVQIRGVFPENSSILSQHLIAAGFGPKVENGDDVRNIMINPTAGFDKYALRDIVPFAKQLSLYVQKNYQSLSPKFSFLIDGGEGCCVLDHKSDIWLSLCDGGDNFAFGLASCPTTKLSKIGAIGKVAFEHGHQLIYALIDLLIDRRKQAPHLQRMKHLVEECTIAQIIDELKKQNLDILPAFDFFRDELTSHYLGIHEAKQEKQYYIGAKPPLARMTPLMLNSLATTIDQYTTHQGLIFTPWQSIIFPNCSYQQAKEIRHILKTQDFIVCKDDVRGKIIACAGAPKCVRAQSNTLSDAKKLPDLLQDKNTNRIHITGCPKSCAATKTYPTTLLAKDNGIYDIYSTKEDSLDSGFGTLIGENLNIKQIAKLISSKD
ncbi:precorrin-3B synthase [Bartonella sp. HY038]|uniref:precorrin-3B synthase n=1 Tax=Bartonella sp. HY038 TaxID=2759660 RepID=UPI0015FCF0E5|nr:precorrin-3B synthase [Bartonella sp. HY038]